MEHGTQSSQHYLKVGGSHFLQKPSRMYRIAVPLTATISALLLGWWYVLSATKPSDTSQSAQNKASSQQSETEAATVIEQESSAADTTLELNQSASAQGPVETELKINSEPVAIPESGSIHRVIQNDGSTTTLDVSVDSQTNGSSQNNTSMNVEVNSRSQVETSIGDEGP